MKKKIPNRPISYLLTSIKAQICKNMFGTTHARKIKEVKRGIYHPWIIKRVRNIRFDMSIIPLSLKVPRVNKIGTFRTTIRDTS